MEPAKFEGTRGSGCLDALTRLVMGKKAPEDILTLNRSHRLQKMGNLQKPNLGSTPHWVTSSAGGMSENV